MTRKINEVLSHGLTVTAESMIQALRRYGTAPTVYAQSYADDIAIFVKDKFCSAISKISQRAINIVQKFYPPSIKKSFENYSISSFF